MIQWICSWVLRYVLIRLYFHLNRFLLENRPDSTLDLVHIFFDTASYDEIERDTKIKFEGQLSLIGGTMGLLTGFSIISGVEIFYFLAKFVTGWILAKIKTIVEPYEDGADCPTSQC